MKGGTVAGLFPNYETVVRALGIDALATSERVERIAGLANVKCLLSESGAAVPLTPLIQFRTTLLNPIGPLSQLVCGDKTAVIIGNGKSFIIHVMQSIETASKSMQDFENHWASVVPILPKTTIQDCAQP